MSQATKRYKAVAVLALFAALVAGACYYFGFFTPWQERVFDRFFTTPPASPDIVIIGIDDQSISALGGWPLARESFAIVLANLGKPPAGGIHVAFADPSEIGRG